jgi:hypothetical protein
MINWKERGTASGIHLGISLAIAALAALLVFGLWYPYPYRDISGGRHLFLIVVGVDVVIGPLITFAIFNRSKPWAELRRDLAMVGVLQIAALGYGVWTVAVARPVHLVFEIDRFRVVHAVDIPEEMIGREPAGVVDAMPWLGSTVIAVRPFRNAGESSDATVAALSGLQIGARPDLWQPYDAARARVLEAAKPVGQLKARLGDRAAEIDAVLNSAGRVPDTMVYLPMVGRDAFWTAFLDPVTADLVAFMPLDPY